MSAEKTENLAEGKSPRVLLQRVATTFDELIGRFGQHAVAAGEQVYLQPYVYLSLHLVQMRAAGWAEVDYDQLAVISGASALFGYQADEFMQKYAHLYVGPDERIAAATGFGYEWVDFQGAEAAWRLIVESVDGGRSLKGWDWENILFAGYEDAARAEDRRVHAIADGPETYARWLTWEAFCEWIERIEGWGVPRMGRHTGRVEPKPAREVALRVMEDLVAWSTAPPPVVQEQYPQATFGLAGIEAYAADCEDTNRFEDWLACHPINPQWTIRNATGVYLEGVAGANLFPEQVNGHLLAAAEQYRAAFQCWQAFYALLGHDSSAVARKARARRQAGAAVVRAWLAHERAALGEVERALQGVGS
jgi:hypothetical protein